MKHLSWKKRSLLFLFIAIYRGFLTSIWISFPKCDANKLPKVRACSGYVINFRSCLRFTVLNHSLKVNSCWKNSLKYWKKQSSVRHLMKCWLCIRECLNFFLLQGKLHLTVIPKVIFIAYTLYHFLKNSTSLQKQYFIWESLVLTLLLEQAVNLSLIKSSFLLLADSMMSIHRSRFPPYW